MDQDTPISVETTLADAGVWAKNIGITILTPDVDKEFDSVCGELAGTVRLPGFRPGKIPRNIIEKRYGDEIKKQVTANLLQRGVRSAIAKEQLEVIGQPVVDHTKYKAERGQVFKFDLEVEVKPHFEVGAYKGLSVEQEEIEVLPEEMASATDRILERFAERIEAGADHAVVEHDVVEGDLRFIVEGNEVHKEDGQLLVMNGHVVGAYAHLGAKFLEGAKIGEKRTVEEAIGAHFPNKEHAGKKATIEFTVKSIRSRKMPELNEELAQKLGMKTVDEVNEKIRSSLLETIGNQIHKRTQYELLDKVVAATPFELPKRLTEMMSARTMQDSMQQLAQMGVDPATLGENEKLSLDATDRAGSEMRRFFIVDAICAKEGIQVQEEDVDEEIVKLARSQNMRASELYDKLIEEDRLGELHADLKIRKVLEFLVDQSDVKIVPRKPAPTPDSAGHEHTEHAPVENAPAESAPAAHDHSHDHSHGHEHGH